MCTITEEKFEKSFEDMLSSFMRFLEKFGKEGQQKWRRGDHKSDLELLLAVNTMCSTSRGVKGAKPIFVIREVTIQIISVINQIIYKSSFFSQVGKHVEPDYSGVNSSAIVFFSEGTLHSMLIIVGSSSNLSYKNIKFSNVWAVVLNLISVYYVTDCHYPAMYGILSLVDRKCLHQNCPRKKSSQKDSTTLATFLKKYEKFVVEDISSNAN